MSNKITIEFAHICENVIVAKNGNLSIINIFNQIKSDSFPAVHPGIIVIIGIGKENEGSGAKEYPITVKIISEKEKKVIAELSNRMITIPELPGQIRFSARFSPLVLPEEGNYELAISISDEEIKRLRLEAVKNSK